jgi:uncharacterized protein
MRLMDVRSAILLIALGCAAQTPPALPLSPKQKLIVEGARKQLDWGTVYYSAYVKIPYPNGDLPKNRGVCTDVVVRALRHAGYDLQALIHQDMKAAWKQYPRYAAHTKPDLNIDHRRVPNQVVFFKRKGEKLSTALDKTGNDRWMPGDIVAWKLASGLDHVGVLTDRVNSRGLPYVIHNLSTTLEEDCLDRWKIVGHYRFPARFGLSKASP